MRRMTPLALATLPLFVLATSRAGGQQQTDTMPPATVQQEAYKNRREQLMRELRTTQQQLADLRGQRVQLQARIENVIAQVTQQRAQQLLMSNETNALQQLDAILTTSQDNLLAQRDRFLAMGDAVRRRSGAALVVLLRADSAGPEQRIDSAVVRLDNTTAPARAYSPTANSALRLGAVDQVYHANVLATPHTVTIQVFVNGQPLSGTATVAAVAETVTYVQFAVRNGGVTQSTWSSRGTTPQ